MKKSFLQYAKHVAFNQELCFTQVSTVDGESFTGLSFHGFDPMKYFV